MAASDLLDQFRKRGMGDTIQRSVVKKTFEAENLEELRDLAAKCEAAIQAHNAEVAAAQAAQEERELFARLECMDESFASPCSTEMTSSGAT
jgi:lysyl-tRNA synthetase class II